MKYIERLKLAGFMLLISALCFALCVPYFVEGLTYSSEKRNTEVQEEVAVEQSDDHELWDGINEVKIIEAKPKISGNELDIKMVGVKREGSELYDGYKSYSSEEISLLTRITYAEAGICDEVTRQAVAATVLARSEEWGKSIYDTIFAPGQFSPAIDGQIYRITSYERVLVTDEMAIDCLSAVKLAIDEGAGTAITSALGGEPLYFYAPSGCSDEELAARANIPVKYQGDKVIFYRAKG